MSSKKEIIIIGNNVQINDYVHIGGVNSIIIEDNTLIASRVFITDHNHGSYAGNLNDTSPEVLPIKRKISSKDVHICKNVWIGESVSILPGVTIGEGSIIGANSVVSKNIPPYSIAVGIPITVIKQYNFESNKWEKVNKSPDQR